MDKVTIIVISDFVVFLFPGLIWVRGFDGGFGVIMKDSKKEKYYAQ